MNSEVFTDMDGTNLKVGDTVVICENCLYVPKLCRGVVKSIDKFSVIVDTEYGGDISIQDERQLLYLFT
jgi:hypothetical protein